MKRRSRHAPGHIRFHNGVFLHPLRIKVDAESRAGRDFDRRTGDITDLRVTRAVVEYVTRHSRMARVTIAGQIDLVGDDVERVRPWGKPARWTGRCNREWRVSSDPSSAVAGWQPYTSPTDTLRFAKCLPGAWPVAESRGVTVQQKPVDLSGGSWARNEAELSAKLASPRNDGDSLEGIRWSA